MDELLGEFVAETLETLETLSGEVVVWEANPSDRDRLDAFFRFFHTVKGSCGFLNLSRLQGLAHAAEDVLAAFRSGERTPDPATITAVLAMMDRIGAIATALGNGDPEPDARDDDALIAALNGGGKADAPLPPRQEPDEVAVPAPAPSVGPVAAAEAPAAQRERGPRTVRISLSLIDQLMNCVSDMVLSRNELARILRDDHVNPDVESSFDRLSTCVADMRDMVSKTRMQRVDRLFAAIPRMVRDLSHDLGKQVDLALEGGDVEMDREMIEMVVDPLTHIVRNALDHGIELPADRVAAGKPATGKLLVSARQSGNQIVIEVVDDGRGINGEALVAKAIRQRVISEADAALLSDSERIGLIFHAGLSTAREVSAISGRGVGMDVVRTNVEKLGGVVQLESTPGTGTTLMLRVPMTLTIIPGLILRCGGSLFAIPRTNIIELLHERGQIVTMETVAGAQIATIRGRRYPVIVLSSLLGCRGGPEGCGTTSPTLMLVRASGSPPYALAVDSVDNHEELVIRPAPPLVMAAEIFAGMTLPDNGRPMLLLDPSGIAAAANLPAEVWKDEPEVAQAEHAGQIATTFRALHFVELTGEHRLIGLDLVERIEGVPASAIGKSGDDRFVHLRDKLVRLANVVDNPGATVKMLHLRVGPQTMCYAVGDVIDILTVPTCPDLPVEKELIAGIIIHEGQHLELLDGHALFAANDFAGSADRVCGICLIEGLADDPWMRSILAPMLVQAGYDVRDASAAGAAGAGPRILLRGDDTAATARDGVPVIQLRSVQAQDEDAPQSLYRYDRSALLNAIQDLFRNEAAA